MCSGHSAIQEKTERMMPNDPSDVVNQWTKDSSVTADQWVDQEVVARDCDAEEYFVARIGLPLLVRYLRLFSTLCGAVTLVFVYLIGLEIFDGRKFLALLPLATMILHPEFVFINAEIANEPLNILLMAAGMWGCSRWRYRGRASA